MIEDRIKIELNAVSLKQAVLCANCDVISDSPHDACLVCGSHSLLPLARVLGKVGVEFAPAVEAQAYHKPNVPANVLVLVSTALPHRTRQSGRS